MTSPDVAALTDWLGDNLGAGFAAPGDGARADVLIELGRRLKRRPQADVRAVAFWLRRANVAALAAQAAPTEPGRRRLPRGTAVHFLPGNTPYLGVYTWSLSFLCGNRSILRVSSRSSEEEVAVYDEVLELLADSGDTPSTFLVRCAPDSPAMRTISEAANVRLLWGSDATLDAVRRLPTSPACRDLAFGDRRSLAAVSASAVLDADAVDQLASRLVGDIAWSHHQACSAPRSLVVVGDSDKAGAAADRLASAVAQHDHPSLGDIPAGAHLDRLTWAQLSVAVGRARRFLTLANGVVLLDGEAIDRPDGSWPPGLIAWSTRRRLVDLASEMTPSHQTLSLFGFPTEEIDALVTALPPATLRRIVAIGASHRFGAVWDGYDLIDELTSHLVIAVSGAPQ